MKLRYFSMATLVVMLGISSMQGLEYLKQFQQGVTAASESLTATKDTVDAVVQLVTSVNTSVATINRKVAQLTKTANGIITNNAEQSVKNSFGTITNTVDISMELLPLIQELTQVLSLLSTRILPSIAKYPGVPAEVPNEVSKISYTITTVVNEINRIKSELDLWIPKVKSLSKNLGEHVVEITKQTEGAVADIKKIF